MTLPQSIPIPIPRTGTDRAVLVRRTYGLVFGGIVLTVLGAAFGMSQPAVMQAVAKHWIISLLCVFAPLIMAQRWHREFPRNIALTLLFTFVVGVWISPVLFVYNRMQPGIIGQAGLLTLTTFGVLSLYATFSRRDFSAWGGFFIIGFWVLLATSLLNLFFRNTTASLWIAGGTVFIFGGLLVFTPGGSCARTSTARTITCRRL